MATVDPALEPVLTALVHGLRELKIDFCIVGALVPELLLETKPSTRTNDADAVVFVPDVAAFEAVKKGLTPKGFSETAIPHRLTYRSGGLADILPYSHGRAARKVGQYAGQKVGHLRGVYSTCSETTTTLNLTPPLFCQTA